MKIALTRLALAYHSLKPGARELAIELARRAQAAGVETRMTGAFPAPKGFLKGVDACCVIGGDGALLGVAQEAAARGVPVVGINQGKLGFLATFSVEEARACFDAVLRGELPAVDRSVLQCRLKGKEIGLALNDIVIKEPGHVRMLRLEVYADEELVTEYYCDGLIVSSPTGSTAYNLSAGGPILHPSSPVLAMTPICPHTLSNRSVIFPDQTKLRVVNRASEGRVLVALDGHRQVLAAPSDPIEISLAPTKLRLAQKAGYSHFELLRAKLQWSGMHARESGGKNAS